MSKEGHETHNGLASRLRKAVFLKNSGFFKEFFKDKQDLSPIRIVETGGWCGPSLGMALDEPQEDDKVFEHDGITYLVNKQLFDRVKPIQIDFIADSMGSGFSVSGNLPAAGCC